MSGVMAPLEAAEGGSTILVVDDNEMNRDLLSRRLRKGGHTVALAEHGLQALEMIRSRPFDLVLLDIMMPEMNGYELLERLKADPALRHIPVIMITAVDDQESVVRCIRLGAEDHLPKPFDPALLFARVSSSLAKKRLHDREKLYAAALSRELEIGRQIQAGFLPASLPELPGWELAARFRPARQVAGDFYDAFELSPRALALVVADVCDKGVGAALFMALFRSLLRALSERSFAAGVPPGEASGAVRETVASINDYIARTHERANMFATLFFGVLDPVTGRLEYVNAGHEPPWIAAPGGGPRALAPTGPAVGLMPGLPFEAAGTELRPGELLLAYTDGVVEARSPAGGLFGEERMLERLREPSAAEALSGIESDVDAFAGDAPPADDLTMLAVRRIP